MTETVTLLADQTAPELRKSFADADRDATNIDAINDRRLSILGVEIADVTMIRAREIIEEVIARRRSKPQSVFFVNTQTLNLAAADREYRDLLNQAEVVFGDGTGVRWAARLQGVRLQDNVNGTDLVPYLFRHSGAEAEHVRSCRYFMLGGDPESIQRAASEYQSDYPLWQQAGYHHGYLNDPATTDEVIEQINASGADLLLVGMGSPIQEKWIHIHRDRLNVAVCMSVGGLFDYAAGNIRRAPLWLRQRGFEWLGLLAQQPHKAGRYLVGNPLFLVRVLRERMLG